VSDLNETRAAIYAHFIATGRAPSTAGIESEVRQLAAARLLALAPNTDSIWMTHPFSAVPTAFPVDSDDVSYWANCAWDAFGIAVILGRDTRAVSRCAWSGERLDLSVTRGSAAGKGAVHFAVPPRQFWDNVGYT
jgi:hypothetical protein